MLLKRSILVILSGLVTFLLLSYIGEYEVFIAPLLADKSVPSPTKSGEQKALEEVLDAYGKGIATAYEAKDPNKLDGLPIEEPYRSEIVTDILFQAMKKRVMTLNLKKMDIRRVDFMGPAAASVTVHEEWDYRYRYDTEVAGPAGGVSSIDGVYTLQKTVKGWRITSFVITEGKGRKNAG